MIFTLDLELKLQITLFSPLIAEVHKRFQDLILKNILLCIHSRATFTHNSEIKLSVNIGATPPRHLIQYRDIPTLSNYLLFLSCEC